jgi:hypothetical protein
VDEKYRSRKFLLACTFTATGTIGLFSGVLGGGEYIGLSATVLGLYAAANVMEKK